VVHAHLPYRISLRIGILAVLAILVGCGGDTSRSEVDALRKEVAELKAAQAQMQETLSNLQPKWAKKLAAAGAAQPDPSAAAAAGLADPSAPAAAAEAPEREAVHIIPISFAPRKGPEIAAVTVVQFADFQCPFCQMNAGLPDKLMAEFPNQVRFVFKNFAIGKHPGANGAAKAAWAAHQQGKFWEMHDAIYGGNIQQLSAELLRGYAEKIGLDMAKYDADVASPQAQNAVSSDKIHAKKMRVRGTPTYFVNGKRVQGASQDAVRTKVQAEIDAFPGRTAN